MQKIGLIIKEGRKDKRMSTHQLAELAGVSQSYISQLENGRKKNPPSPEVIKKISNALELNYIYLLGVAGFLEPEIVKNPKIIDIVSTLSYTNRIEILNRLDINKNNIDVENNEVFIDTFLKYAKLGDYIYLLRINRKFTVEELSEYSLVEEEVINILENITDFKSINYGHILIVTASLNIRDFPLWLDEQIEYSEHERNIIPKVKDCLEHSKPKITISFEVPSTEIVKTSDGTLRYKNLSKEELRERFFSIDSLLNRSGNVYYKGRVLTEKERKQAKILLETIFD